MEKQQTDQQQTIVEVAKVVKLMGEDIVGRHDNTEEMFNQLEAMENKQRKNNLRLKNLREKAESANLKNYLTDLVESIIGLDTNNTVKIDSAFQIGPYKKHASKPRDVLVKFADWNSKKVILQPP